MTFDDDPYQLFSFEPADFLEAALADAADAATDPASYFADLPVFAGAGWPDFWNNVTGAFAELWRIIWTGIGGALRWVWDHVSYGLTFIGNLVEDVFDLARDFITDMFYVLRIFFRGALTYIDDYAGGFAGFLWSKIDDARDWVVDKVQDWSEWVWDQASFALIFVRDQVAGLYQWTVDRAQDAAGWVWDRASFALTFIRDRVEDLFDFVHDTTFGLIAWLQTNVVGPVFQGFQDIGGAFTRGFEALGGTLIDAFAFLGDKIRDAFVWVFEQSLEPFVGLFAHKFQIPGRLVRGEYPTMEAFVEDLLDPPDAMFRSGVAFIILLLSFIPLTLLSLNPASEPITESWRQTIAEQVPSTLLGRVELQEARWRQLPVNIENEYARLGFSPERRRVIEEIDKRIPGPGDLVRMAVREAFSPDQVRELGYDVGFPFEFGQWLARQGFDQDWALKFWYAHWDLPSPQQGFEMFQRLRDEFDETELRALLKALDIPPKWHDRFIRIAYNPLTRVDVRRMHNLGLLTEEQLVGRYQDNGFSPQDAELMARFTIDFNADDDQDDLVEVRNLTASQIRLAYRRHVLDREEALDQLVQLGYSGATADLLLSIDDVQLGLRPDLDADVDVRELTTSVVIRAYRLGAWDRDRAQRELEDLGYLPNSADLLLSLEDLTKEQELTDAQVRIVRRRFLAFDISDGQARGELQALELDQLTQDTLLADWESDQLRAPRKLTLAQVREAREAGIFSDADVLDRLVGLGYTEDDARIVAQVL